MKSKITWHYNLNIFYFVIVGVQVLTELFNITQLSLGCRFFGPLTLGLLYNSATKRNNFFFYLLLAFHLGSNILFYFKDSFLFLLGVYSFMCLRVIALYIIFVQTKKNSALHIFATSFPFLVIFFYLISVTNDISNYEFNPLVAQSMLISVLAGISVSNYLKDDNRAHSWLLISTLLFIGLRFIVFIERFVVDSLAFSYNRPIGAVLSSFAFFTFYKYMIAVECDEDNTTTE
jgi:hypothetical protein